MNLSLESAIPLLILIGIFSALIASMIGLGGGLIAVPLIMLVVGEHQQGAKIISYVSIVALSLVASFKYYRQKRSPQWMMAGLILLGVLPSTALFVHFVGPIIDKHIFHYLYAGVIVFVVILINLKDKIKIKRLPNWSLPIFGILIGFMSGTFGLSGGVLFMPLLIIGLNMKLKDAAVTSLILKLGAALTNIVVIGASGQFQSDLVNVGIPWYFPLIIIGGAFIGSQIGPKLNTKLTDKHMKVLFNSIMSLMFVWEVVDGILITVGTLA